MASHNRSLQTHKYTEYTEKISSTTFLWTQNENVQNAEDYIQLSLQEKKLKIWKKSFFFNQYNILMTKNN